MRLKLFSVVALILSVTLALWAPPALAAREYKCSTVWDRDRAQFVETNCRWVDDGKPRDRGTDPGSRDKAPTTPMMWIRYGLFSAGIGVEDEHCRLWPVDQPLPLDYYRVSAEDCTDEEYRPSREDVERMVHSLSGSLRVPEPSILLGPDPSVNEWNMAVVGLPLWLWTDTPRSVSTTSRGGGMTIELTAELDRLTFSMGDGATVTCGRWTPYTSANPGAASPTCGHVYQQPSLPDGEYDVTATAAWTAQWRAMGYSGSIPLQSASSRSVPVGELQAIVVKDR